jgi:hypothetical protein
MGIFVSRNWRKLREQQAIRILGYRMQRSPKERCPSPHQRPIGWPALPGSKRYSSSRYSLITVQRKRRTCAPSARAIRWLERTRLVGPETRDESIANALAFGTCANPSSHLQRQPSPPKGMPTQRFAFLSPSNSPERGEQSWSNSPESYPPRTQLKHKLKRGSTLRSSWRAWRLGVTWF